MPDEFIPSDYVVGQTDFQEWNHEQPQTQQQKNALQQAEALSEIKQQAFEQGYQQGLEQAQEETALYHDELQSMLSLLANPLKLLDNEVEQELLSSLVWLCKECLNIELSLNPQKIEAVIAEMKPFLVKINMPKTLYLNPQDIQQFKALQEKQEQPLKIEYLQEDERLARGEYRLKTESSELDGRIQARLASIVEQHLMDN